MEKLLRKGNCKGAISEGLTTPASHNPREETSLWKQSCKRIIMEGNLQIIGILHPAMCMWKICCENIVAGRKKCGKEGMEEKLQGDNFSIEFGG